MKRLMTILVILVVVCATGLTSDAAVRVRGYYRSNGTYVQPHYRSNPDGNFWNNWSTYPNINPYTGATGTRRTPSGSGSYLWKSPSYNFGSSGSWNIYSWRMPSSSYPSSSILGGSLWER